MRFVYVIAYHSCNCRFWHIPKHANMEAVHLAEAGAVCSMCAMKLTQLKTNQQPCTVRWTKTTGRVQV